MHVPDEHTAHIEHCTEKNHSTLIKKTSTSVTFNPTAAPWLYPKSYLSGESVNVWPVDENVNLLPLIMMRVTSKRDYTNRMVCNTLVMCLRCFKTHYCAE